MQPNIPAKVRATLYTLSLVLTPVLAYLADQGTISTFWAGLWIVINSAVLGLARANVTPDEQ